MSQPTDASLHQHKMAAVGTDNLFRSC